MHYVYLIKSVNFENKTYIGYTANLKQRLKEHNGGNSVYTKNFAPWELVTYHAFSDKDKAQEFENISKAVLAQPSRKKDFGEFLY